VGLAAVLVAAAVLLTLQLAGPSGRTGTVAAAFEKAEPCGSKFLGLGSRFVSEPWDPSRAGLDRDAARRSRYVRCDPWWPAAPAVMWVTFASPEELAKAVRATDEAKVWPYCSTSNELFLLGLRRDEHLRGFCRDVGASTPVGEPLS
jgi:hypothetical protein